MLILCLPVRMSVQVRPGRQVRRRQRAAWPRPLAGAGRPAGVRWLQRAARGRPSRFGPPPGHRRCRPVDLLGDHRNVSRALRPGDLLPLSRRQAQVRASQRCRPNPTSGPQHDRHRRVRPARPPSDLGRVAPSACNLHTSFTSLPVSGLPVIATSWTTPTQAARPAPMCGGPLRPPVPNFPTSG